MNALQYTRQAGRLIVILSIMLVAGGLANLRAQSARGYEMSALTYDTLGLRVLLEEPRSHAPGDLQRLLRDECTQILEVNGIRCLPSPLGGSSRHPCLVLDLTVLPMTGMGLRTEELYYGTLSFQREVSYSVAGRPVKCMATTWSTTVGGQGRSRLTMVTDLESRVKDFVEDYLRLNSMRGRR